MKMLCRCPRKSAPCAGLALLLCSGAVFPQQPASVTYFEASSALEDEKIIDRYSADKAFDGNPLTSWVEAREDPGIGESIEMGIDRPITVDAIEVMPGYFDPKWYGANNRVKALKVVVSSRGARGGHEFLLTFEDRMVAQRRSIEPRTFDIIEFVLADTFAGSRWNDTCIAEIALYHQGRLVTPRVVTAQVPADSLFEPVRAGQLDVVRSRIAAGADVNERDEIGNTLLIAAAGQGYREIVESLLKAGADLSARGMAGDTALMAAAAGGHGDVLEALAKAGAEVDARDEAGLTALRIAAAGRQWGAVRYLMSLGADPWALYDGAGGQRARARADNGRLRPGFSKLSFGGWDDPRGGILGYILHADGRAEGTMDYGIGGEDRFYGTWWIDADGLHLDYVVVDTPAPQSARQTYVEIRKQHELFGVSGPDTIYRAYEDPKVGTTRRPVELSYQD